MTALAFAANHPFLAWSALWLVWPVYFLAAGILQMPITMWTRFLRARQIKAHGWPPSHLDADGDWKPESRS